MLAYFLAIVMAMISLTLYFNAFISPKIHRQDDFLWSGLGLFYALTLWICAEKITGVVLLGQLAVVFLVVAFIWENRQIRKLIVANTESNNGLEGFSVLSFIITSLNKISQLAKKKTPVATKKTPPKTDKKTPEIEEKTPEIEDNLEIKSEENQPLPKEIIEEKITVVITTEKQLEEDNQTVESVIEEVIKEEIEVDLNEIYPSENNLDDDFDIDSLGLSQSKDNIDKESEKSQGNMFSKFMGFFRKSSPKIKDEKETSPSIIETKESEIEPEIDLNISATEVETAIENLDLVDSNSDSEEVEKITEENDLTEDSLKATETVESIAEEVKTEIVESMTEDVKTEIVESIAEDVKTEIVESIAEDVKTEIVESIAEDVKTEIVESMTEDVKTEILESIAEDVKTEIVESMTEDVKTEIVESIAEDVETEIVESMTEDVKTEIVESIAEDVETEAENKLKRI
jgi:hypothetical protein